MGLTIVREHATLFRSNRLPDCLSTVELLKLDDWFGFVVPHTTPSTCPFIKLITVPAGERSARGAIAEPDKLQLLRGRLR